MPWIYLALAGLAEIGWAVGLKYTQGFTRLWPSVGTVAAMIVSLALLGLALKTLPLGTAILGMVLFGDSVAAMRLCCIALIAAGIVGLKIVS